VKFTHLQPVLRSRKLRSIHPLSVILYGVALNWLSTGTNVTLFALCMLKVQIVYNKAKVTYAFVCIINTGIVITYCFPLEGFNSIKTRTEHSNGLFTVLII
jgi:hypothetical protein